MATTTQDKMGFLIHILVTFVNHLRLKARMSLRFEQNNSLVRVLIFCSYSSHSNSQVNFEFLYILQC